MPICYLVARRKRVILRSNGWTVTRERKTTITNLTVKMNCWTLKSQTRYDNVRQVDHPVIHLRSKKDSNRSKVYVKVKKIPDLLICCTVQNVWREKTERLCWEVICINWCKPLWPRLMILFVIYFLFCHPFCVLVSSSVVLPSTSIGLCMQPLGVRTEVTTWRYVCMTVIRSKLVM